MVKRYNTYLEYDHKTITYIYVAFAEENGEWCKYEDVADLQAKLAKRDEEIKLLRICLDSFASSEFLEIWNKKEWTRLEELRLERERK